MSNLIGRLITKGYYARQAAARLLLPQAPAADARAEALERDGVLILPDFIPRQTIDRVNAANAEWFSEPEELVYSPDGKQLLEAAGSGGQALENFYFLHIKAYQTKFPVYWDAVPLLHPILAAYYRSRYYVRDVYCYRTQPVPKVQGSYAWHQDNYPPGSLKCMILLTAVTASEDGPLTVARGSHRGFKPELGRIGDRHEDAAVRSKFEAVDCVGGPGTAILFNNNAIHRATDPRRGRRDVINFTIFPSILLSEPSHVKGLDLQEEDSFLKKYTR